MAECQPSTIYFGFDTFVLTSDATEKLQQAAKCVRDNPSRKLRVEGHCDARGTQEYNLSLGDKRGQSVKNYLKRLGIDAGKLRVVSKGKLEAAGSDEASFALDRKVEFYWE